MSYASRVSSIINKIGETVVVRRVVSSSAINTTTMQKTNTTADTTVKASVRMYKPNELSGLIQQGDREVSIASSDLANEPIPNDKIIINSKQFNVVSVNTRRPSDVAAIYICQVRG